jgi:hypothetical protein
VTDVILYKSLILEYYFLNNKSNNLRRYFVADIQQIVIIDTQQIEQSGFRKNDLNTHCKPRRCRNCAKASALLTTLPTLTAC